VCVHVYVCLFVCMCVCVTSLDVSDFLSPEDLYEDEA
jgi:hypothetical protein